MVSTFVARPLVELKQRDKSKVEAILTYGNRLLVGLSTGALRVYRLKEDDYAAGDAGEAGPDREDSPSSSQVPAVELMREIEKFSRRAIEQLAIIKEAHLLLCLSDGYVTTHDLQHENYAFQLQLSKTKGASTFAVTSNVIKDPSTGIPSIVSRLAVGVRRKILLWSWQDTELVASGVEVTLAAAARTLAWADSSKLICGLNSGYVLLEPSTQSVSNLVGPGGVGAAPGQDEARLSGIGAAGMGFMGMGNWMPKPLATTLTDGELLLAKDVNTLFLDKDGRALSKRQIQWTTAPDVIAFSYPYLLALQPPSKGILEVRNPKTLSLLQSIGMPNATKLHVPQPNISLAHAGKGFLVASGRCVWRMTAESYESQIEQLLEQESLDEAISLIEMLEDALLDNKEERLRQVKMQKAEVLFHKRRYRASLDLFTEVSAPPERVISLYPSAVAGELSASIRSNDDAEKPAEADVQGHSAAKDLAKDEPGEKQDDHGTGSTGGAGKKDAESASMASGRDDAAGQGHDGGGSGARISPEAGHSAGDLHGKDLKLAVLELYSFLAENRRKLQLLLEPDGSLRPPIRAANLDQDTDKKKILRTFVADPEQVLDDDLARLLRAAARLVDTTLFRAYMVERPARAGSLFRIPNFCDPDVVQEKLLETGRYEDLVDFLHGKRLHREALELLQRFGQAREADEAPPALRGPKRIVAYLQVLPPDLMDFILEFAAWPLAVDPDLGMEVFLADTEIAENLPRERVLDFLNDIDLALAIRYLEHIIYQLNDLTPEFHQRLVRHYLEKLTQPDEVARSAAGSPTMASVKANWKERMLSFLKSSNHYSTGRTFNLLPKDDPHFYEARAVVLSKMGNHKQALEIYVFKLEDQTKAEEYCNQVYMTELARTGTKPASLEKLSEDDAANSIYHTLLSLYLKPPSPHQPHRSAALNILSKHGSRLAASSMLDLIPASLPIEHLESYFHGRLRAGITALNEGRALRGLRYSEHERLRAALLIGDEFQKSNATRNRSVVVSEERVCRVCHKRLGRSVISVFPDNSVVHYGCASRVARQT